MRKEAAWRALGVIGLTILFGLMGAWMVAEADAQADGEMAEESAVGHAP